MRRLHRLYAVFLLLCFVRVLVPEAWLLALHVHHHTEQAEEQALKRPDGKHVVTTQHQHCHVEQLFNAPFQPATAVRLPARPAATQFATFLARPLPEWGLITAYARTSRGPPAA